MPGRRPAVPARHVGLLRRARLQVGIALEEGNKALAVVAGSLLALLVLATVLLHFTYRPAGQTPAPRRPGVAVLRGRDGGHRGLRRLHVLAPARVDNGVRHRAHRGRGGTGVDGLRSLHEHLGQPAHRALPRSPAGPGHDRPRDRDRPGVGGDQRRSRPGLGRPARRGDRTRHRQPLPGPGPRPRRARRDRGRHAGADAPHGEHRGRQGGGRPHQRGPDQHRDGPVGP